MFNIGSGELALIAVVALLILGPKRLPELARGIGKFMREFRRQTDEVRGVVEREFYKMDQDLPKAPTPLIAPSPDAVAVGHAAPDDDLANAARAALAAHPPPEPAAPDAPAEPAAPAAPEPPPELGASQLMKGTAPSEPVAPPVPSPDPKR